MSSTTTAQRYPLSWPSGWPRTPPELRVKASFGKSKTENVSAYQRPGEASSTTSRTRKVSLNVSDAANRLEAELDRLGASDALLSTNQRLRMDGTPRSDLGEPVDVGAAVYFQLKGKPLCLACDKWNRVADNVAALAQHIDALRRIERYGVGRLEQAFAGYAQLPPSAADWKIVLELGSNPTRDDVVEAHRRLTRKHHPDVGGRHEDMARINEARDLALQELS